MPLYADASAILAWLLREPQGEDVAALLAGAANIVSSEIVMVECDRALLRLLAERRLPEPIKEELSARVAAAVMHWTQLAVTSTILLRARQPFANRPLRTLDAIHLASALEGRRAFPDLAILSLDDRMRRAARAIGFEVLPAPAQQT